MPQSAFSSTASNGQIQTAFVDDRWAISRALTACSAGALLAEVGPLDASTIVFSKQIRSATAADFRLEPAPTRTAQAKRKAATSADVGIQAMLAAVLPHLAECLTDANAAVISSAQKTLRELMLLREATGAMDQLPSVTRQSIEIFRKVSSAGFPACGHVGAPAQCSRYNGMHALSNNS